MKLNTEKEFVELLPPLAPEEKVKLEKSLQQYGCRDSITIWQERQIILDGHNRYELCQKHGIDFKTTELSFESGDEAKLWMLRHQLSRRNLNAFHRTRTQLLITNLEKNLGNAGDAQADLVANDKHARRIELEIAEDGTTTASPADSDKKSRKEMIAEVARQAGVSQDTVRKVDYLEENIDDSVRDKLMRGETSISKEYQNLRLKEKPEPREINEKYQPVISKTNAIEFLDDMLSKEEEFSLLLTEPPSYSEWQANGSVDDYMTFYQAWLEKALKLLPAHGRAFIFADTDINVLNRQLSLAIQLNEQKVQFSQLLIWTFKPQPGDTGGLDFANSWQGILYFKGSETAAIKRSDLTSVLHYIKDYNNDFKYKDWRKPIPLLKKLIQTGASARQKIIDPFCGSGHFLLTAGRMSIYTYGSEINDEMFNMALENGCQTVEQS